MMFCQRKKNTFLSSSSGWPYCRWTKSSAAENFVGTGLLKRLISLKIGRLLGQALVGGILAISYRCMRRAIGCLKSSQIFGRNHCRQTGVFLQPELHFQQQLNETGEAKQVRIRRSRSGVMYIGPEVLSVNGMPEQAITHCRAAVQWALHLLCNAIVVLLVFVGLLVY